MSDPKKLRLSLVDGEFLEAMARVMAKGNKKEGRVADDWKVIPLEQARVLFRDALLRHELEDRKHPGSVDPESGELSLVSIANNAMMLWWHERNRVREDGECTTQQCNGRALHPTRDRCEESRGDGSPGDSV